MKRSSSRRASATALPAIHDVIGYVRISCEEEGRESASPRVQRSRIESYCTLYSDRARLVDVIEDIGCSGKDMNRPGLQRALEAMNAGRASGIVVAKLDRLTRSVRDLGTLLDTHFMKGNYLGSVSEQIDTSTPGGRMILHILASIAQWERETIVERTLSAMADKRKNGEATSHAPYGFRAEEGDRKRLIPEPDEQAVIARVRTLLGADTSIRGIVATLASEGVLGRPYGPKGGPKTRSPLSKSSVEGIIRNLRESATAEAS